MSRPDIPRSRVVLVTALSLLPSGLIAAGVLAGSPPVPAPGGASIHQAAGTLTTGFLTHAILGWSIFCTAVFIAVLSFIHSRIDRTTWTPLIGLALLCAGGLDLFHLLATDHLLMGGSAAPGIIPLTWAVSRVFYAVIVATAATVVVGTREGDKEDGARRRPMLLGACASILWTGVAILLMAVCVTGRGFPQTIFGERLIARPWDIAPLLLLGYAGLFALVRLHRRVHSCFSQGLVLGVIPQIAAELHMVLGAVGFFDAHATAAHALVLAGTLIPLAGLVLDLVNAQRVGKETMSHLEEAQRDLNERSAELERVVRDLTRRNGELDEFTYIASHDLQEPLRKLTAFSELLRKDLGDELPKRAAKDLEFIVDAASRMQTLVHDLLELSRVGRNTLERKDVSLEQCVEEALEALTVTFAESNVALSVDPLPVVRGDRTMLSQLYQNLIANALKFSPPTDRPHIHLTVERRDGRLILGVRDDGIGIAPEHAEAIFAPFKRLHGRGQYEGTGIGLAICRKTVERHGGEIWVESEPGQGAHFRFTLEEVTGEGAAAEETPAGAVPRSSSPAARGRIV